MCIYLFIFIIVVFFFIVCLYFCCCFICCVYFQLIFFDFYIRSWCDIHKKCDEDNEIYLQCAGLDDDDVICYKNNNKIWETLITKFKWAEFIENNQIEKLNINTIEATYLKSRKAKEKLFLIFQFVQVCKILKLSSKKWVNKR